MIWLWCRRLKLRQDAVEGAAVGGRDPLLGGVDAVAHHPATADHHIADRQDVCGEDQ